MKPYSIIQSISTPEFNTFDVKVDNVVIAYFHEIFVNDKTNERFDSPVYDIYYDYDIVAQYFASSLITDNFVEVHYIIFESINDYFDNIEEIKENLEYAD
jgi:hypothetical protein